MNKGFMILGCIALAGGIYYLIHNDVIQLPRQLEARVAEETKIMHPHQKHTVIVFGTPHCYACKMAKDFLSERNIRFIAKDVTEEEARAEMEKFVPNAKYVPQIIVGEVPIGGYNELLELYHQGKFMKMINGQG